MASEVRPREMFAALVAANKADPLYPPPDAWTTTLAELFARAHEVVFIDEELVPPGKRRFPQLRSEEKDLLFTFFDEACICGERSFADWTRQLTAATRALYNTSWSFTHIVQNMLSKLRWARLNL